MIPLSTLVIVTPLLLKLLFAEPMVFLTVWLLLGWFLLRSSRHAPGTAGGAAVGNHHQHRRTDPQRVRTLKLVLVGIGLYLLLRSWRNR